MKRNFINSENADIISNQEITSVSHETKELQELGQDVSANANEHTEDIYCKCSKDDNYIAYDTNGVLKCTKQDCAFYIENFVETFLDVHSVVIH